jgi:K+-transporting ATPase KdpF subunit
MSTFELIALLVAVALLAYLIATLLRPEWF